MEKIELSPGFLELLVVTAPTAYTLWIKLLVRPHLVNIYSSNTNQNKFHCYTIQYHITEFYFHLCVETVVYTVVDIVWCYISLVYVTPDCIDCSSFVLFIDSHFQDEYRDKPKAFFTEKAHEYLSFCKSRKTQLLLQFITF